MPSTEVMAALNDLDRRVDEVAADLAILERDAAAVFTRNWPES